MALGILRPRTKTEAPATANNPQPDRPDDLQIRFSTVGGSYVDVTGRHGHRSDHFRWDCHGCKAHSEYPVSGYLHEIREGGNTHANQCRAIPL